MSKENNSSVNRGIVYVEIAPSEKLLSLIPQLTLDKGKSLLEAIVRYSILDPVNLKLLGSRVWDDFPRTEGITLITKTAFDALLIAREIILYRYAKPVEIQGTGTLHYRVGVHCSGDVTPDNFSSNSEYIQIAQDCAKKAKKYSMYCTNSCIMAAQNDRRREKKVLDEFEQISPDFWLWRFEEGLFNRTPLHDHTYFISYSRTNKDKAIADHIELLLRRKGRRVLRDENFIQLGVSLDNQLGHQIRRSDTFISIYSKDYDKKPFCRGELKKARENREKYGEPSRIALGRTSLNIDIPAEFGDDFYGEILDRKDREIFISSLIEIESR